MNARAKELSVQDSILCFVALQREVVSDYFTEFAGDSDGPAGSGRSSADYFGRD